MGRFLVVMNKPALVHALPVLGHEPSVRPRLHGGMIFLTADKAFHQSRLLVNQFRGVLMLGHNPLFCGGGLI